MGDVRLLVFFSGWRKRSDGCPLRIALNLSSYPICSASYAYWGFIEFDLHSVW